MKKFSALERIALISLLALRSPAQDTTITSLAITNPPTGSITNISYFVDEIGSEKRIYKDGHHFLSVLTQNGIFALRPHPGNDVDGWGSTLYLQPFISGAVLAHTDNISCNVITNLGKPEVQINANGGVSRGTSQTYGTWSAILDVVYDSTNKEVNSTGYYQIDLQGKLSGVGDMSYAKLASNRLYDVPTNDGSVTNTGDMAYVAVDGDGFPPSWPRPFKFDPALSGSTFPQDWNNNLTMNAVGNYNNVDTLSQGYTIAISPASKPSLSITMQSRDSSVKVMAGIFYNVNERQNFAADNVGITPYINQYTLATHYAFDIAINSSAIPTDDYSSEAYLSAQGPNQRYSGVYFSPSLSQEFERIGSILGTDGAFNGKFKVNSTAGYFKLKKEY